MLKKCILCGNEFEPKVVNRLTCYNEHKTICKICGKDVSLDNKRTRDKFLKDGYVYCGQKCACIDNGRKQWERENAKVDLDKLKYLKTETSLPDSEIAKQLNTSVDFVVSRCNRYNWTRPEHLELQRKINVNNKISNVLSTKYKDLEAKNEMVKKCQETYCNRTGYTHNFKNPESIKRSENTKLQKYGNKHYVNSDKMVETRLNNNGGSFWTPEQKEQSKQTKLQKYGSLYSEEQINKSKQTRLAKYGDENYTNSEKISESWNSKSVSEKQEILNKIKRTKLQKYGDENYVNQDKMKTTCMSKYGVDNASKSLIVKNKIRKSMLKLYGVEHYHQIKFSDRTKYILSDCNTFRDYILSLNEINRNSKFISTDLQIGFNTVWCYIHKYKCEDIVKYRISTGEIEVKQFLDSLNIKYELHNRKIIKPKELDIYIPQYNLAIEFNGTYWHSYSNIPDKNYHYNKSKQCEEKGIRLIHIWEYEWNNERQRPILENIIKNAVGINEHKIYARKCNIVIKESKEMKDFFNKNNIQGFRPGKFAICLEYNNEIIMSYMMGNAFFGNGKYEWEVIRGATKLGYNIVGGASKIWKYFINTYKPNSCVYYIDYNYFNGNSLPYLGLTYIKTQPSFKNYFVDLDVVKNRDPIHNKQIQEGYKNGTIIQLWNAGTKVYLYTEA